MSKLKLDDYEKEIEKNIVKFRKASKTKINKVEEILQKANEKKTISLRVNSQDIEQLKLRAEQDGIPYQTLISSILHKFVTDQLLDQREIIKSLHLLRK